MKTYPSKPCIGIIKELDGLGRVVIPKDLREHFRLEKYIEFILTEDGILIRNPEYELVKKKNKHL